MGLLSRLSISNGNPDRKDSATRMLNNGDKNRHDDFNAKLQAEIARKESESKGKR